MRRHLYENDEYYPPEVIRDDDKVKIVVRHPILTEEERAIRMKRIHDAAVKLVLDTEAAKAANRRRREEQNHETEQC